MPAINKKYNEYARAVDERLYEQTPKAVFAAVAVSALTTGGDYLNEANGRLLEEWWILYDNGIVPQKPPRPRPSVEHAEYDPGSQG